MYTRSVCDTLASLQLQLLLVSLYKCYVVTFTFLPFTVNREGLNKFLLSILKTRSMNTNVII